MADTYGATTLPVSDPGTTTDGLGTVPVGDPGIAVLLEWAAAVLTADVAAGWDSVAPGEPIIRRTHPHDPREEDFATSDLPALFAYREPGKLSQAQDGNWGEDSTITLLWVYPPATDLRRPAQRGVRVAIGRAIHRALGPQNGRHPSWVVAGDADPFAAAYGSSVLTHGGFVTITATEVRAAEIQVGQSRYDAVTVDLAVREDFLPDVPLVGSTTMVIRQQSPEGDVGFTQTLYTVAPGFSLGFSLGFR